ncbi:hypothetical protein L0337_33535 [candidate division KSB1 bacterium]|nr:hypothetical protein [candidate division KSB1 bacterium]
MEKRWVILSLALLLLVNLYVFSDGLRYGYLAPADDFHHVHAWKFGQRALGWVFLSNVLGNMNEGGYYRPFEVLSYMIDTAIWGEYVAGRHLTNFLFHFFNTLLVFVVAYFITQSRAASLIAGLLFSVHPAHYFAVGLISGRTDLIGTTFCLSSLVLFAMFIKRKSLLIYALSLVAFLCCLLMKELAFIVPLLVLSFELFFSRQNGHAEKDDQARKSNSDLAIARNAKSRSIVLLALGALSLSAGVLFSPGVVAKYLSNDGAVSEFVTSWVDLIRWYAIIIGGLVLLGGVFHRKVLQLFAKLPGRYALSFFIVLALYLPFRMQILGNMGGYNNALSNNVNTHLQISPVSFVRDFYSVLGLFWPLDYDYRAKALIFQKNHEFLFWGIFVGAILFLLVYAGKYAWKHKPTAFTLLMMLMFALPTHNILLKMPYYETRYLYLLTVPLCLFIGVQISRAIFSPRRRPLLSVLGCSVLLTIIFAAGAKLAELNQRYVETGRIMRRFVVAIEKHKNLIMKETDFFFLTFPFLPIDSDYNVYVTAYLNDAINFAVGESNWTLDDLNFALFVDHADRRNMKFSRFDSSGAIIENVDVARTKTIPASPSADEISLASLYDPSWRDPHPAARTLKTLGPAAETRHAFLRIKPSATDLETATVTATFKATKKDEGHNKLFVLYNLGEFEITQLTN